MSKAQDWQYCWHGNVFVMFDMSSADHAVELVRSTGVDNCLGSAWVTGG